MLVGEMSRQRSGRPPLPPEQRKSVLLKVRLRPDEADAAYRYALKHGRPLDHVLRNLLARLIPEIRATKIE